MPRMENPALNLANRDLERALWNLRRIHLELLRETKPCGPEAREFRKHVQQAKALFERGVQQTDSVERALSPAPEMPAADRLSKSAERRRVRHSSGPEPDSPAGVIPPRRGSLQGSEKRRVRFIL
ncbi:hypothetical protein BO82DRAFT_406792 [Aspergillus uvarum CBS 121591]|uniref:Uncharacterized protein n=1 Tax=Aspergillus uvarum CBS 121591 TaxID=1448315 RepID=A0A319BVZ4_9EURO|nr:hypothetical protein BO82DRAFT_406792 [Aspergillus uvarum CBS 121591]PYH76844.1 hypothetical protein BO82DRAFT_406792 [Aspergillus uvarum CBS 121591]